jgi:hypothetical protein
MCSSVVLAESGNSTQPTTPSATTSATDETVTVVDPRHPLFGRTLRLIGITNKSYLGQCCVVWMQDGVERNVPITATDRSPEPFRLYPLPLDLSSVQRLLKAYARLRTQLAEETEDGTISQPAAAGPGQADFSNVTPVVPPTARPHPIRTGLAGVDPHPAADGVSHLSAGVPQSGRRCRSACRPGQGGES